MLTSLSLYNKHNVVRGKVTTGKVLQEMMELGRVNSYGHLQCASLGSEGHQS